MQPSSLVLLAIVVVWAAYLVPHWVRRRDELSQSRDGDRFSGGLRVLKRRDRSSRPGRSGDPLLTSPRVIVDTDGEFLYIPADRLMSERLAGSSMSLPQSAQPGELLTNSPQGSDKSDELEDEETGDAGIRDAGTGTARPETPSAAPAPSGPEAQPESGPEPRAELPTGASGAETQSPATAPENDPMAELEAGLLAGFGLPSPVRPDLTGSTGYPGRARAESIPVVQSPPAEPAPSAPTATDVPHTRPAPSVPVALTDDRTTGPEATAPRPDRLPADGDDDPAWLVGPPAAPVSLSASPVSPSASPSPTPIPTGPTGPEGAQESFEHLLEHRERRTSARREPAAPPLPAESAETGPAAASAQDRSPRTGSGRDRAVSTGTSSDAASGRGRSTQAASASPEPSRAASGRSRPVAPPSNPSRPNASTPARSAQAGSAQAGSVPDRPGAAPARPGSRTTPTGTSSRPAAAPKARPAASPPPARPVSFETAAAEEAILASEYTTIQADLDAARSGARIGARRRARSMAVLLLTTLTTWVFLAIGSAPVFIAIASTLLLAAHGVASRTAAVRSRETLTMLGAHLYAAEMARDHAEHRRRQAARARARAEAEAAAAPPPERVARRASAVSADTWDPIPVPPPTYQLKPAVHRPEPPPLEDPRPAQKPQSPAASERSQPMSRGSMPRRAADIERILELDQEADRPRAVNE